MFVALEKLGRRGVPDNLIVAHLRSRTDTNRLTGAQVGGGRVSSTLLTFYQMLNKAFERDQKPASEVHLPEPPSTQEIT